MHPRWRWSKLGRWTVVVGLVAWSALAAGPGGRGGTSMSLAGSWAKRAAAKFNAGLARGASPLKAAASATACVNTPDCPDEDSPFVDPDAPTGSLPSTQSEVSIAVDRTGQHIVIGYNDFRGFSLPGGATSVSGYLYSDDGGKTFHDGGQLPVLDADRAVFGDPDVKYLGGCNFVYSSIYLAYFPPAPAPPAFLVQTMSVHVSRDCGHTWQGPYEVTAATNPNGQVDVTGAPLDAADKEYLDVDPDTGRVLISWTNFGPTGFQRQISTAYTDDILASPPTWSPRTVVSAVAGQASIPRFAAGSRYAYMAWSDFWGFYGNGVGFSVSADKGATWSAPVDVVAPFFTMDHVLGDDRVHDFPAMAVDTSRGPRRGTV